MNPSHPHMIVVGLMDGNVAVYNLQMKTQHPVYISDARNGKHKNLINQVNNVIAYSYQPRLKLGTVLKLSIGIHTFKYCLFLHQKD